MVAILVMPLAVVNEVSARWFLGPEVCDMWISFDVLCCTSSILHLVAISVDRYWAVTRVDYIHNRPASRIFVMIALSWGISTVISIPPLFGWKTPDSNPDLTGVCLISQDWGYTVYSTVGAFYLPLMFMIIIYLNVYRAARVRIRKKHFRRSAPSSERSRAETTSLTSTVVAGDGAGGGRERHRSRLTAVSACASPTTVESPTTPTLLLPPSPTSPLPPLLPPTNGSSSTASTTTFRLALSISSDGRVGSGGSGGSGDPPISPSCFTPNGSGIWPDPFSDAPTAAGDTGQNSTPPPTPGSPLIATPTTRLPAAAVATIAPTSGGSGKSAVRGSSFRSTERRAREKREQTRERKAARTLGIITGSFVICWLPFFIIALVRPFCGAVCHLPDALVSVIGWLGYFNSLLNPVIYTVFNPDFRLAFSKILFGKYRHRLSASQRNGTSTGGGLTSGHG